MMIQWNPTLECGVEQVDNEHKALFGMVAELAEFTAEDEGTGTMGKALDFLGSYVVNHFAHEEELMHECSYPQTDEHAALHTAFVETFLGLKQKYLDSNESYVAVREIYYAAAAWLYNHVTVIDYRFAQYYKEFMRRQAQV